MHLRLYKDLYTRALTQQFNEFGEFEFEREITRIYRDLDTKVLFFERLPCTISHPCFFFFRQKENGHALQGENCLSQNSASA